MRARNGCLRFRRGCPRHGPLQRIATQCARERNASRERAQTSIRVLAARSRLLLEELGHLGEGVAAHDARQLLLLVLELLLVRRRRVSSQVLGDLGVYGMDW